MEAAAGQRRRLYLLESKSSGQAVIITPRQVNSGLGSRRVKVIAAAKHHTIIATENGEVFTWGSNRGGIVASPTKDFGWHDPGYIHSAVMSGLQPSQSYMYRYGSDSVGWSGQVDFRTPPASGAKELLFLAYGDMGKAPLDQSVEHYIQPGSLSVIKAIAYGIVDSIFHIGDISYATGFLAEWDFFLNLITPLASRVSYMTAIGNHERDYEDSGSVYITPDSGGECGVPYETYFSMPIVSKDKPWYLIEQATVHFTVIFY